MDNYLKKHIKIFPDFPRKGIIFQDLLPLLLKPQIFSSLIENMANQKVFEQCEAIVGIESRGFIFGTAIAQKLSRPLILARKPGKLPGDLIEKSYELEYGESKLSIQKSAIELFNNFTIVDDLLATGGTANCVYQLLSESGKNTIGLSVVAELEILKARENLSIPVNSEIII